MRVVPKYKLYFNKQASTIKIEKQSKAAIAISDIFDTSKALRFNDCCYLSDSRNALVDKALEIRDSWMAEHEASIEKLKNINFKKRGDKA